MVQLAEILDLTESCQRKPSILHLIVHHFQLFEGVQLCLASEGVFVLRLVHHPIGALAYLFNAFEVSQTKSVILDDIACAIEVLNAIDKGLLDVALVGWQAEIDLVELVHGSHIPIGWRIVSRL